MKIIKKTKIVSESSRQDFEEKLEKVIEEIQRAGLEVELHFQFNLIEREGVRKLAGKYDAVVLGFVNG